MNQHDYTLWISLRSPFARRIRIALQKFKIPYTEEELNVFDENPELWRANPLGAVPTLLTPDAGAISESTNILEYLHEKTGAIWPHEKALRTEVRQASVWCTGIMQSLILYFQEKNMHEVPSPKFLHDHALTVADTFLRLNELKESAWFEGKNLTQAGWDLYTTLEYATLRYPEYPSEKKHPSFKKILEVARKEKFFTATTPPPV